MSTPIVVSLIPDPAANTGIQLISLLDDTPGAQWDGATLLMGEDQSGAADITTHPVETGANIADNIRPQPEEVTYVFLVASSPGARGGTGATNQSVVLDIKKTPLNYLSAGALLAAGVGALGDLLFGAKTPSISGDTFTDFDPIAEMLGALRFVRDTPAACQVVTSTGTLDNMFITKIGCSRKDPGGAEISVTLRQIFTVSSATVDTPKALQPRGAASKSAGAQAPAPAPAADSAGAGSILSGLAGL